MDDLILKDSDSLRVDSTQRNLLVARASAILFGLVTLGMWTSLLSRSFLHNDLATWLSACAVTSVILVLALGVRAFVRSRLAAMQMTDRIELMELPFEVASKTAVLPIVTLALVAGLQLLQLQPVPTRVVLVAGTVVGFWQLGTWGSAAVLVWLESRRRRAIETDRAAAGSLGIIAVVLRAVVWSVVGLLTLDNLGVDITALVAGLGVGGIAVALAVQNILGDLFASLSITLDRPFVIGDFIVLEDFMGSVEHIGVKSTRLRSLGGEQIVLANADLLKSRLRNYGRMAERRVVFSLGVTYETPVTSLRRIPEMVRATIEAQGGTRFDRCHFAKYGDFALVFEAVYYVLSPDYNQYMDTQQAINLSLFEAFERSHLEFAYPTQKVWMAPQRDMARQAVSA